MAEWVQYNTEDLIKGCWPGLESRMQHFFSIFQNELVSLYISLSIGVLNASSKNDEKIETSHKRGFMHIIQEHLGTSLNPNLLPYGFKVHSKKLPSNNDIC